MNIALTLLGIAIGITVTVFVGRHYFRRTIERKLTPFIHLHSEVFAGIDPEVRKDIQIFYKNEEVNDLTHYQVLIANTGDRAIRDFIKPLTVIFPENVKILDVSILHKSPKELELRHKIEANKNSDICTFEIPLLNKEDFFLVKFLLKGEVSPSAPEYRITVDDIPPKILPEWLSNSATTEEKSKIEWEAFGFGIGIIVGAVSLTYLGYLLWKSTPSLFPYPWSTFQFNIISSIALIFAVLFILAVFLIGLFLAAGIGFEEVFSQSKYKFPLPRELRRGSRFLIKQDAITKEIEENPT